MTYQNQLEHLVNRYPDSWDYYGIHRNNSVDNFFKNPTLFIENTFMFASKKLLAPMANANSDWMRPQLSDARAAHSISAFFLGALIAKNLFNGAFTHLFTDSKRESSYDFSYIWTLTCLYHDCGYTFENNNTLAQGLASDVCSALINANFERLVSKAPCWLGMAKFRAAIRLQQSIWKSKRRFSYSRQRVEQSSAIQLCGEESRAIFAIEEYYRKAPKRLFMINSDRPICFPIRKSNEISRYFAYRLLPFAELEEKSSCIDHGIAGGCLFFDRIIRNYAKAYVKAFRDNPNTDISDFENPNDYDMHVHFTFDQLPVFAYIADCIINHNIWSAKVDTSYSEVYRKMGMSKLIGQEYEKINFFRNPLLFILAVSDSIEPYKVFSTQQIDKVPYNKKQLKSLFNRTRLEVNNDRIVMKPPRKLIKKCKQRLEEMQEWIDVECCKNGDIFEIIPKRYG
ncbi:MAG: hypothetical protein HPY50_09065 [Firmicutes bacterium]|nr:hypothetical protein [Bacillota bacterium]